MKDQAVKFLKEHNFCVVSSVNAVGKPESAFVAYTCNDKLEIVIGTSNLSRKFKNISNDPFVSIVVADMSGEAQYEGQARIFYDKDEAMDLPGAKKYRDDPTQVWLRITPKWLRLVTHGETDKIEETTDFV